MTDGRDRATDDITANEYLGGKSIIVHGLILITNEKGFVSVFASVAQYLLYCFLKPDDQVPILRRPIFLV